MNEKYEHYLNEKAFFDFAVKEGLMSAEECQLIAFYRAAKPEARHVLFDLVMGLPWVEGRSSLSEDHGLIKIAKTCP